MKLTPREINYKAFSLDKVFNLSRFYRMTDEDTTMDPPEIPEPVFSDEEGESEHWPQKSRLAPETQPFDLRPWYEQVLEANEQVHIPFYTDFAAGAEGVSEQISRAFNIRNEYPEPYQPVLVTKDQFFALDNFPLRILFMRYENYDLGLLAKASARFKDGLFVVIGLNSKETYQWLGLEVIGMIAKNFLYVTYVSSEDDQNSLLFHPEDSILLYDRFLSFFYNYEAPW
jgi:hypothetical protein